MDKHSDEVATRIRFGLLLKRIRDQGGLTQQELAAASLVAQSTISDLELAKKKTRRSIVVRLDKALNANGVLLGAWDTLFAGAGMTTYFREVADSEQAATKIQEYSLGLVPGLYQVESYVRAISELAEPHATPEAIDQIVGARQKRQELLEREHPPRIIVLLDEAVLLRRFRDPKVMAEQIDHLLKLSYRRRLDIQIVPIATEGHAGLGGSFKLMEVPGNGTFVYIESQQTGMSLKQPEVVASYERTFAELRSAALPVTASRSKMEEIRGSIT
ncbi:Scr1 family TA system antitoxin-like transcriptional regulator [Nocardiopsis exhalans]|uniref:Scr1 family TA system antitoxin-like transcriptional regulator n=1 Tax=Nocardiopsis exhalans TaxID=163604 RepID=A0ABY5DE74_9ACTN|nr:Scr1 family TA system antitoxin-like transcriptional regulator [Nocardiopsis exhalans]USY22637.1 Scr1 family TA system antitoxin-like transcriptional regulator [Nocardiopsis exhalans]